MKVTAISLVDSAASDGVRQSTENPPARRPQVLVNAPNHLPTLSLDTNLEDSCIREAEERQTNTDLSSADNACGSSDDSTHFKHAESQSNQESGEWDYEGYDTDGCPHEAVEYLEGERIFVGSPDPDDPGYETPETALNSDAYVPALSDARWNIQLAKKASKMAPDPFLFISFHEHTAEATRFRPTIVDPGFNGQQQTVPSGTSKSTIWKWRLQGQVYSPGSTSIVCPECNKAHIRFPSVLPVRSSLVRSKTAQMSSNCPASDHISQTISHPGNHLSDLPSGILNDNRWRRHFVPTILRLFGLRLNPWFIDENDFVNALQLVWDAVYDGEVSHHITPNDAVYGLASHEVNIWRKKLGDIPLSTLASFFGNFPTAFRSNSQRSRWCASMIANHRLFYEHPEGMERTGLFESPFMAPSLAFHLEMTSGSYTLSELSSDYHCQHPVGAIGLAAAGVFRVAHLWRYGQVQDDPGSGSPTVVPYFNASTGRSSEAEVAFSAVNYGNKTYDLLQLITGLEDNDLSRIVRDIEGHSHVLRRFIIDFLVDGPTDSSAS